MKNKRNSEKQKNGRTKISSSNHSFLTGMVSIFDISGSYFKRKTSYLGFIDDKKALEKDWKVVGTDLKSAIMEKINTSH